MNRIRIITGTRTLTAALAVALIACLGSPLKAAFKDAGWGARPLGMGGAFAAVADDANASSFNPAGLVQPESKEVSFMSSKLFTGLDGVDIGLNYLSYLHPMQDNGSGLAVTWMSLSSPALYREDTLSLSYGLYIDEMLGLDIDVINLSAGASVKYLRHEYSLDARTIQTNDPVFSDGSFKGALSADVGLLAFLPKTGLSAAFVSKNMTQPNVGLKTNDAVTNENVLGLAYYTDRLPYLSFPCFTGAIDLVSRGETLDVRLGAESWVFDNTFALRAGFRPQEIAFGLGYETDIFKNATLAIDYALGWPLEIEKTTGSHRFSLSVRFP